MNELRDNGGKHRLLMSTLRARAFAAKAVANSASLAEAVNSMRVKDDEDYQIWRALISKAWANQEYMTRVIKEMRSKACGKTDKDL